MRKTLTDKGIAALKPRPKRYAYPDPELAGHYVRITPNGAKSFATVTRSPDGKQVWTTLGATDRMTVATAREMARDAITRVRAGMPAFESKGETFGDVVASWRKRHVERNGLRSRDEIVRLLERHILPAWHNREFISIRRSDIAALMDRMEDENGARQADYALNIVRSIMNWHAVRTDSYNPPMVRGMRRQSAHAQARGRILDDGEIRAIWKAAENSGTFGAFVRIALLTAQRRAKVLGMRWADISESGEWTIPKEPREKDSAGTLVLPDIALAIIRAQPQLGKNPYVFAGRGVKPINGFSKGKTRLDAVLPKGTPPWVIHDLRRTARSLMSRAGVSSEHAERVLGHRISGVEGVYDRHSYRDEKADALRRLAALIDAIVHPRTADVVPMAKRKKRR
jgi:integrase